MVARRCIFFNDSAICELKCFGDNGACRYNGKNYDEIKKPCEFYSRKKISSDKRKIPFDGYKDRRLVKRDRIIKNPNNPRDHIDPKYREELKQSIKATTIENNLLVRPWAEDPAFFELAAGYTRFDIAHDKDVNIEDIPVFIQDLDDREFYAVMFEENDKRKNLNPFQEAKGLLNMVDTGMKQQAIAKRVGKSQPWVANTLRLLKAPDDLRKRIISQEIMPKHVIMLIPFVEFPIYKDIIAEMDGVIEEDGGITVVTLKNVIVDTFKANDKMDLLEDRKVLNIDDFPQINIQNQLYPSGVFDKYFDTTDCDGCKTCYSLEDFQGNKERYCYNKDCWENRVKIATLDRGRDEKEQKAGKKAEVQEEEQEDLPEEEEESPEDPGGELVEEPEVDGAPQGDIAAPVVEEEVDGLTVVNTNELGPNSFKYMPDRHQIDKTECNDGCKDHKQDQHGAEICTNQDCYTRKRNVLEREGKRGKKEEAIRVVEAVDHYLDEIGDSFLWLDNIPEDDPQIKTMRLLQHYALDQNHVDSIKKGMRRWDEQLKDGYEGKKLAQGLKGVDIIKSILRVQFFRAAASFYPSDLDGGRLKEIFPEAVKYYKKL